MTLAAVGLRRTKLQVLQPIAGRMDSPLFNALAAGAEARTPATTPAAPIDSAETTIDIRFSRGRTGPPHRSSHPAAGSRGWDERWDARRPPKPQIWKRPLTFVAKTVCRLAKPNR